MSTHLSFNSADKEVKTKNNSLDETIRYAKITLVTKDCQQCQTPCVMFKCIIICMHIRYFYFLIVFYLLTKSSNHILLRIYDINTSFSIYLLFLPILILHSCVQIRLSL